MSEHRVTQTDPYVWREPAAQNIGVGGKNIATAYKTHHIKNKTSRVITNLGVATTEWQKIKGATVTAEWAIGSSLPEQRISN
jgi:hypothetical protein